MSADDRFNKWFEEAGNNVMLRLLKIISEMIDTDVDFVDLEEIILIGRGEISGEFDLGGDTFLVHLQLELTYDDNT